MDVFFFFAFVCTFFGFGGLKMGDFFLVPLQAFYCISMSRRWKLKQMRPNTKFQKLRLSPQWLLMALFSMVAVSFSNSQNPPFQFFSFYHKKSALRNEFSDKNLLTTTKINKNQSISFFLSFLRSFIVVKENDRFQNRKYVAPVV